MALLIKLVIATFISPLSPDNSTPTFDAGRCDVLTFVTNSMSLFGLSARCSRFRIRSTMFSLILLHLFIVFERLKVRVALVLERAFLVRHGAFLLMLFICAKVVE